MNTEVWHCPGQVSIRGVQKITEPHTTYVTSWGQFASRQHITTMPDVTWLITNSQHAHNSQIGLIEEGAPPLEARMFRGICHKKEGRKESWG